MVGLSDNTAQVWHKTAKEPRCTFEGHQEHIVDVGLDGQSHSAISIDQAGILARWNPADGRPIEQQRLGSYVSLADFHPSSSLLAFANDRDQVLLWNYSLSKQVSVLPDMMNIRYLAFSPDGHLLGVTLMTLKMETIRRRSTYMRRPH